jgi:thiol-disulfide isomerase/thioredoxin
MNRRLLILVSIAIAAAIVVIAIIAARHAGEVQNASQAPTSAPLAVGGKAPEFAAATTAGAFGLATAKKPVFLEVFASWCPHCQRETKVLKRLYAAFHPRMEFVAVSGSNTGMDGVSSETQADVVAFAQRFSVTYPVAFDPNLTVANLYLQGGFPTIAIIDAQKNIAYLGSGEITYGELAAAIAKVLAKN